MAFVVALGAVLLLGFGNILQKKGHQIRQEAHKALSHPVIALLKSPFWLLGVSCGAAGTMLYNYALVNPHWGITLVQPVMSLNPIVTGFLAFLFLKERLDRSALEATALVIAGVLILGIVSDSSAASFDEGATNVLIAVLVVTMGTLFSLKNKELRYALVSGFAFGLAAITLKASSYVVPASGFDAMTIDSLDTIVSYLMTLISQYYLWLHGLFFVAAFILFQFGFAHGRATILVAYSAALGMVLPVIAGFTAFGEPVGVLKIGGIIIILYGIIRPVLKDGAK
ncbi:MAG: DMT family transporter [Fibrobacterales bacterium]